MNMNNPAFLYSEYKKRKIYFNIATFTAGLASTLFVVGLFAATVKFWQWQQEQIAYGLLGLLIVTAITFFQHLLYSAEDGRNKAQKVVGAKIGIYIAIAISASFNYFTEVGGGMEREEARMMDKSVNSPVFQSMMDNIGKITGSIGDNKYSSQIAEAEAIKAKHELELDRCSRHAEVGQSRVDRCKVYEQTRIDAQDAKIASFERMATDADTQRGSVLQDTMAQAKQMERDENNHHPMVKLFKSWFDLSSNEATFLLSSLIILVFEFAFHYQGKAYAKVRDELIAQGYDLTNGKGISPHKYEEPVMRRYDEKPPAQAQTVAEQPANRTKTPAVVASAVNTMPAVTAAAKQNNYKPACSTWAYSPGAVPKGVTIGQTELIITSTDADTAPPKNGIGFTATQHKPSTPAEQKTDKPAPTPATTEASKTDQTMMSTPEARALLNPINNPKFDDVFVAIATGETPTAIGKAAKKHGTGAEQVQNTLVCLEYCGIVSAKNSNGQRQLIDQVSEADAKAVMAEIKNIIRGTAA